VTSGAETDGKADAINIARTYLETGNYERAREVVSQQLSQDPNDPVLLAVYADAELRLENYPSAAESARAALSIMPSDAATMRIYALAIDGMGRSAEALELAWRSAIDNPNDPVAHWFYAWLLHDSREFGSALIVVDEALRLRPSFTRALFLRGLILRRLGRIEESIAAYQRVLELDPDNAEALHNLAVNRLARGKLGRALTGLLGAARLDPMLGDLARVNIGLVLSKMLSPAAVIALVLGVATVVAGVVSADGDPTAQPRIVVGLITAALIVALWRVHGMVPRHVFKGAVRRRPSLVIRVVHAVAGVGCGLWVTAIGVPACSIAAGFALAVVGLFLVKVDP
jgi:tetratricopeptide (TPR) repeat protein